MASILSAGTTLSTALVASADTTGSLQLASNNGTVAVTINTSQYVGIGTTSPANRLDVYQSVVGIGAGRILHVNGNSVNVQPSYNYYDAYNHIFRGLSGAAESMRIDSSGNVGIGTSSPSTYGKFVIAGGDGNTQFNVGTNGVLRIAGYNSSYSGALLESVNTAQSAYLPITINGSYTVLATGGTERMRIDSSGNVGIGTSTMTAKLNVTATSENVALFQNSNNSPALIRFREPATTSDPYIAAYGNAMAFGKYGAGETMRIDANGNIGIGITPNTTWYGNRRALQIGGLSVPVLASAVDGLDFMNNSYTGASAADYYTSSGFAAKLRMGSTSGQFQWFTAPTGLANTATIVSGAPYAVHGLGSSTLAQWQAFFSALVALPAVGDRITATATGTLVGGGTVAQQVTFTQAMTLDASGNLGIGDTSPSSLGRLVIAGAAQKVYFSVNSQYAGPSILSASGQDLCINPSGRNTVIGNNGTGYAAALSVRQGSSGVAAFSVENTTADTSYFYINSTGNVGIGTASPAYRLDVGTGSVTGNIHTYGSITSGTLAGYSIRGVPRLTNDTGTLENTYIGCGATVGNIIFQQGNSFTAASNTERMRIDSSGNVGIGTTSPGSYGKLTVNDTAAKSIYVRSSSTNFSGLLLENTNSATKWQIGVEGGAYNTAGLLNIGIDAVGSKMAIDSSGRMLVGTTTNTYGGHALQYNPGTSGWALAVINSKTDNSTATDGLLVKYSGVTPIDGYQMFLCQDGSNVNRFYVLNNGATGGTSDGRLKKNITTARDGYLEDLGKIRVVKYNWNEQPEGTPKELGWIAQEVEQVFPQMISTDAETGYKSVKYSVFVPLLIKAIQEQQALITSLTARVMALEGTQQ